MSSPLMAGLVPAVHAFPDDRALVVAATRTATARHWINSTDTCLAQNVGEEFGRIGLRIVGRKLSRLVDDIAHCRIDLLELVLARHLLHQKTRAHLLDRIVLGAHLLYLVARAIFRRVRHGVPAIA